MHRPSTWIPHGLEDNGSVCVHVPYYWLDIILCAQNPSFKLHLILPVP